MTASDEAQLIQLLNDVYGSTYSYRQFYKAGIYSNYLNSTKSIAFGAFLGDGTLISHTAFNFIDPKLNYVESGMSLRRLVYKKGLRDIEKRAWEEISNYLSKKVNYIHQQTTTYHSFAQKYAEDTMNAIPSGMIFNYVTGEQVQSMPLFRQPMHAITYTTSLNFHKKYIQLPDNPYYDWLVNLFDNFGRLVRKCKANNTEILSFKEITTNETLSLCRLSAKNVKIDYEQPNTNRLTLVHVPCDGTSINTLISQGYYPVGIRVHSSRQDEIIMQNLSSTDIRVLADDLRYIPLYNKYFSEVMANWVLITQSQIQRFGRQ